MYFPTIHITATFDNTNQRSHYFYVNNPNFLNHHEAQLEVGKEFIL